MRKTQRLFLKVKLKSLTAEAQIIRFEEKRNPDWSGSLAFHRRTVVRREARHTLLAYAFLKGTPYLAVEPKCHTKPDWTKVEKMVIKYGVYWEGEEHANDFRKAQAEQAAAFRDWIKAGMI